MSSRILFLSANLPFPPHSGPTNRTLHILRELRRTFQVSLLAFARRQHHPSALERVVAAQELAREISDVAEPEPIPNEWSVSRKLSDHARSIITGQPYTYYEYASRSFAKRLRHTVASAPPALVHLDSIDLCRWATHLPDVPVTCTHHSIESELLRRRADRLRPPRSWYVRRQASLVESVERRLCPSFALNLMMSERERQHLETLAPGTRSIIVPNGVDGDRLRPGPTTLRTRSRVVFVGPLYIFANRDALEHFVTSAWPEVRSQVANASLRVIGSCPPAVRKRLECHAGVECLGYVDDLASELAQAACAVVPLRVGGGTRLKILDAWATGTPVVSTTIGCEGLAAADRRNILVVDHSRDFAAAVVSLMRDSELAGRLGAAGRRTIEELYDWKRVGETLRKAYSELIDRGRTVGSRRGGDQRFSPEPSA